MMHREVRWFKRTIILICFLGAILQIAAQNTMRIYSKDGGVYEVLTENVDSITFVEKDVQQQEASLMGSWLWGSSESGYYELLTFDEDYTYVGYDCYFTYGFDTKTYGFFSQYGTMLTLWSNGFGYQRRYTWYITGLAVNALSVMTKMGSFTYYRLQPEVIKLKVGEPFHGSGEEEFVFADGVVVRIEDNKLKGVTPGETYILKMDKPSQMIWAYKVMVE